MALLVFQNLILGYGMQRFLLVIVCLFLSLARAEMLSQDDYQAEIEQKLGPILSHEQAPHLYDLFIKPYLPKNSSLMDTLGQAQRELLGDSFLSVNRVKIVESHVSYLQMKSENTAGSKSSLNTLYITKGFLKRLFAYNDSSQNFNISQRLLIGAIILEFANPTDHEIGNSIKKNFKAADQAFILKRDINALLIAERADLNQTLVYEWL